MIYSRSPFKSNFPGADRIFSYDIIVDLGIHLKTRSWKDEIVPGNNNKGSMFNEEIVVKSRIPTSSN